MRMNSSNNIVQPHLHNFELHETNEDLTEETLIL
jgi:hypothetical protein